MFAKLLRSLKLSIKQYRTWQCNQRSGEFVILDAKYSMQNTTNIANTDIRDSVYNNSVYFTLYNFGKNNLQIHKKVDKIKMLKRRYMKKRKT